MIKLTEGNSYENPYAAAQYRAWANVMHSHGHVNPQVGFYNYAVGYSGKLNADYFIEWLHAFGMDKDTAVSLDFEDPSVAGNGEVNEWLATVKKAGFNNVSVYSMASWFGEKLNTVAIQTNNFWVSDFSETPNLVESKFYKTAFQFTDNWKGLGVDMSLDYGHILVPNTNPKTVKPKAKKPKMHSKPKENKLKVTKHKIDNKPQYAKYTGLYKAEIGLNLFLDANLTKEVGTLPKGTLVHAQAVADGNYTRLQLASGLYATGRTANPTWVQLIKKL